MDEMTTEYGTWNNHGDRHNLEVAATIKDMFDDSDGFDLDAIESEYRQAINDALPAGIVLAGNLFIGPGCSHNGCTGCPACDENGPELREIIAGIDLWAIIERHEQAGQ